MTEDKNAIQFPKGQVDTKKEVVETKEGKKEKEPDYVIYVQYYIPFTLIFGDGTTGRGKETMKIKEGTSILMSDIENYIVKGFVDKGEKIKDIIIDNMVPEIAIKVPVTEKIDHFQPPEKK